MNLQDTLVRDILPRVQKPSRYLGNELNAVTSTLASDCCGMSNCLLFDSVRLAF